MNKIILFSIVLISACSHINHSVRGPAQVTLSESGTGIEIELNTKKLFVNGANGVYVSVKLRNSSGATISVDPSKLILISDIEVTSKPFKAVDDFYEALVVPKVRSPKIRFMVAYQGHVTSSVLELQTTLGAYKSKIEKVPWSSSTSRYVSGLYYSRTSNILPDQYEGFAITNLGKNLIVDQERYPHSQRQYDFEFEQLANQNNSLLVTDAPNQFTSHFMYSHLMLFPRRYLPHVERKKDRNIITLPTGEQMSFNPKSGEVIDGVFEEGPVDVSGDRFKRHYADLKYRGKGILLRANARGQMPQQGQFESTKIDMEFGIKGSADVLIINGSTGQRCRRPKSDFWPSEDVTPIPFKFPSDEEFDSYLRSKCQFGIPELDIEVAVQADTQDSKQYAQELWSRCQDQVASKYEFDNNLLNQQDDYLAGNIKSCLNEELSLMDDVDLRMKVIFDLYVVYLSEKEKERKDLIAPLKLEEAKIKERLLGNLSWIQDPSLKSVETECRIHSGNLPQLVLRYHKLKNAMNMMSLCSEVKVALKTIIDTESKQIAKKMIENSLWSKTILGSNEEIKACQERVLQSLGGIKYGTEPSLYLEVAPDICNQVESSNEYLAWLKENTTLFKDKVFQDVMAKIEVLAMNQAKTCVNKYPINNTFNQLRYKFQRDNCLTDEWSDFEKKALNDAFKNSVLYKAGLTMGEISRRIAPERNQLQLKVMKNSFQ